MGAITDIPGIRVGHYTDLEGITGCTVVLCGTGAVAGVAVRGAAPGTRETDLLRPTHLVQQAHAVLLAGGSAFGLDAAGGVMRYLEEQGIGHRTSGGLVPIVPAAILYDLAIGNPKARPDAAAGYAACRAASAGPPAEGSVGAGTGATVGKVLGMQSAMKGGLGTASVTLLGDIIVGAIVAVNAYGDVVEPATGRIVAGAHDRQAGAFLDSAAQLRAGHWRSRPDGTNTVIGVIATNASLDKEQANRMADIAHDGLALAIRPAHTMVDGDVTFVLALADGSAGRPVGPLELSAIASAAVQALAEAIVRGVRLARGLGGVPGVGHIVL